MSVPRARSRFRVAPRGWGGFVLLGLFALPFLGVGLASLGKAAGLWTRHASSARFRSVPAELLDVELVSHSGRSTSHEVVGRYRYVFPPGASGTTYESSDLDVGIGPSGDAYHVARHAELRAALDARRPVTALVDPRRPERAILFRSIEAPMLTLPLFGLVFAGAGGGLLVAMALAARGEARRRRGIRLYRRRPWKAQPGWGSHAIPAATSGARGAGGWLLLAILQGFVGFWWLSVAFPRRGRSLLGLVALTAVQAALAGGVVAAGLTTLRRLRHGRLLLVLDELPVVPGRDLRAAIELPRRAVGATFSLELRCERAPRRTGAGEGRTVCHAQTIEVVGEAAGARRTLVPVRIPVPADAPESAEAHDDGDGEDQGDGADAGGDVTWQLRLTAALPGLDVDESWEIPVVRADPRLVERRARG
jgi:hypothetical protein